FEGRPGWGTGAAVNIPNLYRITFLSRRDVATSASPDPVLRGGEHCGGSAGEAVGAPPIGSAERSARAGRYPRAGPTSHWTIGLGRPAGNVAGADVLAGSAG